MDVGIGHTKPEQSTTLSLPPKESLKPQQASRAQKELTTLTRNLPLS
jgi:hypothetical protein